MENKYKTENKVLVYFREKELEDKMDALYNDGWIIVGQLNATYSPSGTKFSILMQKTTQV